MSGEEVDGVSTCKGTSERVNPGHIKLLAWKERQWEWAKKEKAKKGEGVTYPSFELVTCARMDFLTK